MQINSINPLVQSVTELTSMNESLSTEKSSSSIKENSPGKTYDMRHMSLSELNSMINELHENGTLSSKEAMELSSEQGTLELFGGYPKDAKIDMLDAFQNHIDLKKSQHSKGVEYVENALEVLKGIDAHSKAKIPAYV